MRWPMPSRSQIFQRALGKADRARALADPVGIVEQHHGLAPLRQIDRERQPDRTGADHDHRDVRRRPRRPVLIGVTPIAELGLCRSLAWVSTCAMRLLWPRDSGLARLVATATILNTRRASASTPIGGIFGHTRSVQICAVPAEPARGRGLGRAVERISGTLRARYSGMAGAGDARLPQRRVQRAIHLALHPHPQIHHQPRRHGADGAAGWSSGSRTRTTAENSGCA